MRRPSPQLISGYCEICSRPIERTIPSIIINTGNLVYKRTAHFVSIASWSKDNTLQFIELYRAENFKSAYDLPVARNLSVAVNLSLGEMAALITVSCF